MTQDNCFSINLLGKLANRLLFCCARGTDFTSHQWWVNISLQITSEYSLWVYKLCGVWGVKRYLWRPLVVWRPCGQLWRGTGGRQQHGFTICGCRERLWFQFGLLFDQQLFPQLLHHFFLREGEITGKLYIHSHSHFDCVLDEMVITEKQPNMSNCSETHIRTFSGK